MALDSMEFGYMDYRKDGDCALLFSYFTTASRETLSNDDIIGTKMYPILKRNSAIPTFINSEDQQTMFAECLYFADPGAQSEEAS